MKSKPLALPCLLAPLALIFTASCGAIPTAEHARDVHEGALMERTLREYRVVRAQHAGRVGYMKVCDVAEAGGPVYSWRYVYDLSHNEVGWIDQFGNAHALKTYTPYEAEFQKYSVRQTDLPEDSVERNVMRMLGINPATDDVSFPMATNADM